MDNRMLKAPGQCRHDPIRISRNPAQQTRCYRRDSGITVCETFDENRHDENAICPQTTHCSNEGQARASAIRLPVRQQAQQHGHCLSPNPIDRVQCTGCSEEVGTAQNLNKLRNSGASLTP